MEQPENTYSFDFANIGADVLCSICDKILLVDVISLSNASKFLRGITSYKRIMDRVSYHHKLYCSRSSCKNELLCSKKYLHLYLMHDPELIHKELIKYGKIQPSQSKQTKPICRTVPDLVYHTSIIMKIMFSLDSKRNYLVLDYSYLEYIISLLLCFSDTCMIELVGGAFTNRRKCIDLITGKVELLKPGITHVDEGWGGASYFEGDKRKSLFITDPINLASNNSNLHVTLTNSTTEKYQNSIETTFHSWIILASASFIEHKELISLLPEQSNVIVIFNPPGGQPHFDFSGKWAIRCKICDVTKLVYYSK